MEACAPMEQDLGGRRSGPSLGGGECAAARRAGRPRPSQAGGGTLPGCSDGKKRWMNGAFWFRCCLRRQQAGTRRARSKVATSTAVAIPSPFFERSALQSVSPSRWSCHQAVCTHGARCCRCSAWWWWWCWSSSSGLSRCRWRRRSSRRRSTSCPTRWRSRAKVCGLLGPICRYAFARSVGSLALGS